MPDDPRSSHPKPSRSDKEDEKAGEWSRLTQLVFEFLGYLAVMGYMGSWLDERYDWNGRGLFAGLMFGMAAWLYRVLKVTRGMFK